MEEQVLKQRQFWKEIQSRMADRRGRRETPDPFKVQSRALALLRYLNMKWLPDGHTYSQGSNEAQPWCPFPSIRTRRIIDAAAGHPFIRRLQFIRQLGTTYLHQSPDAAHTRWSHSIGVAECAGQFLDALDNNNCSVEEPEDAIALAIGALIHDALQGPCGHSLEVAGSLFVPDSTLARLPRLDKLLLRAEIDNPNSDLMDAIEVCLRDAGPGLNRDLILNKLQVIIDKETCRKTNPESYYLAEILDSSVDADRLDYLKRDAIHTHYDPPAGQWWSGVVQGVRTEWLQDPENKKEKRPLRRLVFHIDHRDLINRILTFRRDMYTSVYEHPSKIVIDDMLNHALFYTMRGNRILPAIEEDPDLRIPAAQGAREVLRLTDDDLLYFIFDTSDQETPQGMQALELLLDVYRNRPYTEILPRYTINRDQMKTAEKNLDEGVHAMDNATKECATDKYDIPKEMTPLEARYILKPDEFLVVARNTLVELSKQKKWGRFEDLLLFDFYLLRGRFIQKYRVEQAFWTRLLGLRNFVRPLENYFTTKYGTEEVEKRVQGSVPLVHISLTGYGRYTAREMLEHATEPTSARLAFYNPRVEDKCKENNHTLKEGCGYSFHSSDPATSESFETWSVIISCPWDLAEDEDAISIIRDQWEKFMFQDRAWILAMRK